VSTFRLYAVYRDKGSASKWLCFDPASDRWCWSDEVGNASVWGDKGSAEQMLRAVSGGKACRVVTFTSEEK